MHGINRKHSFIETAPDAPPSPKSKKFKYGVPPTLHGWSSVLVLLTWGRKL